MTISKVQFSRLVEDIVGIDLTNSSKYYIKPNNTPKANVNNNKIGTKISIVCLDNSNKYATFATDKGTFVLLTIKELILCLI